MFMLGMGSLVQGKDAPKAEAKGNTLAVSAPAVAPVAVTEDGVVSLTVDTDYTWDTHVTADYKSDEWETQKAESLAWAAAIKEAAELNAKGDYGEAVAKSPLSRQKAWFALNLLRKGMGGTRDANKSWPTYTKTDSKTGLFSGTAAEKALLISLAGQVKDFVAAAVKAGMSKDMNGLDCQGAATWADSYLTGILK